MITMTSIKRVVFGQHDVEYSKAFERLFLDTTSIGGFPPYPRKVIVKSSGSKYSQELDEAYHSFLQSSPEKFLAKFLTSDVAQNIFKKATHEFLNYKVKYDENRKTYEDALNYFKTSK